MDDQVLTYVIPKPAAVPASTITGGDWTTLNDRMDVVEDMGLADLSDVNTTGATDGDTLMYDSAATPPWVVGSNTGLTVRNGDGSIVASNVESFYFLYGVEAYQHLSLPDRVVVRPTYGGTGTTDTVARSDHYHSAPVGKRGVIAATGVLSSGTRDLVSTTFGPLTSGITYDVEAWFVVRARNNVNNGTFNLLCRVGADAAYPQLSRNVQTVGGVPVDQHIDFGNSNGDMVIVGTGASIAIYFGAQFSTGDAVDLRDGFYRVIARPRS